MSTTQALGDSIVVKDFDGTMKVLSDGELKDLDTMLENTQVSGEQTPLSKKKEMHLTVPRFTDLAIVPEDEHFKEPEKKTVKAGDKDKSDLQFHSDDELDIENELDKINAVYKVAQQKRYSIDLIAKKLIDKHQLELSDIERTNFIKILLSRFRQIRSGPEAKTQLTKPKGEGGLAVSDSKADHILSIVHHLKEKIDMQDGVVVEENRPTPAQPKAQPAPPPKPKPVPKPESKPESKPEHKAESMPKMEAVKTAAPAPEKKPGKRPSMPHFAPTPPEAVRQHRPIDPEKQTQVSPPATKSEPESAPESAPKPVPKPKMEEVESTTNATKPPEAVPVPKQKVSPITPIQTDQDKTPVMPKVMRPEKKSSTSKMQDVRGFGKKGKPKLSGPIDELNDMKLQTWRMLDEDPRIRSGKILGKIQNLQQESFTRKSQGIDAWRNSGTYKQYMVVGQQSLEQNKDVAKVIEGLLSQDPMSLTLDEFEAISDLNRALRF